MAKTIIQVPVEKSLRDRAAKAVRAQGFSSLQESIRLYLHQVAAKKLKLSFEAPPVQLSKRAAARYDKMIRDVKAGRVKTKSFTSVDALMKDLAA